MTTTINLRKTLFDIIIVNLYLFGIIFNERGGENKTKIRTKMILPPIYYIRNRFSNKNVFML